MKIPIHTPSKICLINIQKFLPSLIYTTYTNSIHPHIDGWIDKLWADWQSISSSRLTDIGGPNAQDPNIGFIEIPGTMEEELQFTGKPTPEMMELMPDPQAGDGGPETTLNHVMTSFGVVGDARIGDIMDTRGGYLCYVYV